MKIYLLLILFLLSACQATPSVDKTKGPKTCFCEEDTLVNQFTTSCDTTILKNKSKLYWQFNCDRIWLTLENKSGHKKTIHTVPIELYPYTDRLGYDLIKEFDNVLLFSYGCSATAPCRFILLDKKTGNKKREFKMLLGVWQADNYPFDFLVDLEQQQLHVYFVNEQRSIHFPLKEQPMATAYPDQQFSDLKVQNNILTMIYATNGGEDQEIRIDLD